VNGYALVNSADIDPGNNKNQMVIVNGLDGKSNAPLNISNLAKSINLVTGLSVGSHYIVPAAYSSYNFDITYSVGNLNITPAPLTIRAKDSTITYEDPFTLATMTSTVAGIGYNDKISDVLSSPPSYSLLNNQNNPVTTNPILPGTYKIMTNNAQVISANYTVNYEPSQLVVKGYPLTIRVNDIQINSGDAVPSFTSTITGLKNGTVINAADINYTISPAYTGAPGIYVVTPNIPSTSIVVGYDKNYVYGILSVNKK
jgi:hypothetical protein